MVLSNGTLIFLGITSKDSPPEEVVEAAETMEVMDDPMTTGTVTRNLSIQRMRMMHLPSTPTQLRDLTAVPGLLNQQCPEEMDDAMLGILLSHSSPCLEERRMTSPTTHGDAM